MCKPKAQSQSCDAALTIGPVTVQGSTGQGSGHAEMTALSKWIDSLNNGATTADTVLQAVSVRKVYCPSRPVCKQCAAVLQGLGFTLGDQTKWGSKTMGSTEWGLAGNVKELLFTRRINYDDIINLRSGNNSNEYATRLSKQQTTSSRAARAAARN